MYIIDDLFDIRTNPSLVHDHSNESLFVDMHAFISSFPLMVTIELRAWFVYVHDL